MRRLAVGITAAAALFGGLALSGAALPGAARSAGTQQGRTIQVLGEGTVETVPDTAGFGFGVVTRASSAKEALAANAAAAQKVIDALKGAGVATKDIRTQQVSLSPQMNKDGTAIVGYQAQNTVSATVRDIGRAGAVVDAAVGAGANQVSGPYLTSSGRAALQRQALTAAFDDAKAKAEALARQAGGSLGPALQVSEQGAVQPVQRTGSAQPGAVTTTPVEPGTEQVQAQVSVTFALQ